MTPDTCRDGGPLCESGHVIGGNTDPGAIRLRGRDTELRVLANVLDDARARRGASLLLTGGPGRGKSTLLAHLRADAGDFTVLHCGGVTDEADLPLAGLERLLRPLSPHPAPLGEALAQGRVGDRLALSTALLDRLTGGGPLLVCVDDAERLDSPSLDALAFAARRLSGTATAIVFAARDGRVKPGSTHDLVPGVPEQHLAPLTERALHDILTDRSPVGLPASARTGLVRAAHGNPAVLLGHLENRTTAPEDSFSEEPRLPARLRADLLSPYRGLPERTRSLLLLAALDGDVPLHLLARAAGVDGSAADDLEPAEEAGAVRVEDDTVVFADPLVGRAFAQDAPASARRAAHRALAAVSDPGTEPVRFVRHTAAGADGPDAALADAVEAVARTAKRAAGRTAAALAHERAALLTPDPDVRACRLNSAAYESYMAGRSEYATLLTAKARPLAATDRRRALIDLVDAQIAMRSSNAIDVAERLYAVGRDLIPHDRLLALRTLVRSSDSASLAGDPVRHARAAELALPLVRPEDPDRVHMAASFLEGCTISFRGDYPGSTPLLREAVRLSEVVDRPSELIWGGVAGLRLSDSLFVRRANTRAVELSRQTGERATVPAALGFLVFSEFWSGRFPSAAGTALHGLRVSRESGQTIWATQHLASLAMIAAIQGDIDTCRIRARAVASQAGENSLGLAAALASWALAVLELSRGNAAEAFFRLRSLVHAGPGQGHPTMRLLTAPHFIEAATRIGEVDWARTSLAGYRRWADSIGSPAALALAERCAGLLAAQDEAADHFESALAFHRSCGDDDVEHARTQLLFGAYLRRARLPGRAREHLHNAQESFERFGARLWVRQTRAELRALGTGERGPESPSTGELTAQQQQIARLVAEGATNREVAAHMFISPRTVEHHLRGIFRKLGIRSRVDLARLFN